MEDRNLSNLRNCVALALMAGLVACEGRRFD